MTARLLRLGFLPDGVWKALVGAAMLALAGVLAESGAPVWLLLVAAAAVLVSAVAEIAYAVRGGAATHTRHLVVYDAAWVLVSVAAVLLAPVAGSATAWVLWLGFQALAAPVVAVLFACGAWRRERPGRP